MKHRLLHTHRLLPLISLADQPPLRLLRAVTAWTGNITCKWNNLTFFLSFKNFYSFDLHICGVNISYGLTLPGSVEGLSYDRNSLRPAGAKTALWRVIFNRRSRWSYFWLCCRYINIIYSRLVLSFFWWVASVFESKSSWTPRNWPTTPPSNLFYMNCMPSKPNLGQRMCCVLSMKSLLCYCCAVSWPTFMDTYSSFGWV